MKGEVVVGVCGRIGSGKTTLSAELANRLGCPRASFGDHVRAEAQARGLDTGDRVTLQNLGDGLIAQGWMRFVLGVLGDVGYQSGSLVVDGIRHMAAVVTLREIVAPTPVVVVAVQASDDARDRRLLQRGLAKADVEAADSHHNEAEIGAVLMSADVIVSADSTVEAAATRVMEALAASPG